MQVLDCFFAHIIVITHDREGDRLFAQLPQSRGKVFLCLFLEILAVFSRVSLAYNVFSKILSANCHAGWAHALGSLIVAADCIDQGLAVDSVGNCPPQISVLKDCHLLDVVVQVVGVIQVTHGF